MIMSPIESSLQQRLRQIKRESDTAIAGLPIDRRQSITLVAVSKLQPCAAVREAFQAGQRDFGENYVQEGVAKIIELASLREGIDGVIWHFIGPLQRNKAKLVAQYFSWVHGIDRLQIAEALSRHRAAMHNNTPNAAQNTTMPPLNVCVQVNVSGEASKSGVMPAETLSLAKQVAGLPALKLRGLMTIIENTPDTETQRTQFRQMRELQQQLLNAGLSVDTLSMGMSQDFKVAIEEGATMIRIGSALFGERVSR